jgi:transposase
VLDEHRYGFLPVISRTWALRGVRVHAPYATRYKWGYLHEALEVDGENKVELFFTPAVDQDVHALFLKQIADGDPLAIHVVIADQAGFHLKVTDERVPANVRLLPLPPYCPELNPVERFGGLIKAPVANRLYPNLRKLENHITAASKPWSTPTAVSSLIHGWLAEKVNCGART